MRHCPPCQTDQVIKNGSNGTGKPKYACNAGGRQFVDDPAWRSISDEIIGIIARLLLERIRAGEHCAGRPGGSKLAPGIGQRARSPRPARGAYPIQQKGRVTIACDERWSCVGNKDTKDWVWLALDRDTRESVGIALGARDTATARQLWESLPPV